MRAVSLIQLSALLLTLCNAWNGFSQSQTLNFHQLSVKQGLSNSSVLTIHQDTEGFMWFGTSSGLNKYDGYTFTIFNPDPKSSDHSLLDDHIYDIHEDRNKRLWIGAYGLNLMDKRTGKVTPYLADSSQFTYLNVSCTIYEDKNGKLWTSAGGGLNRFDPDTKKVTSYRSPELVPNFGIVEDSSGTFWMGSGVGLYQFHPQTGRFTSFPVSMSSSVQPFVSALLLDENGKLWIGTSREGLFVLDTRVRPAQAEPYSLNGKVNKRVNRNGIVQGRGGILWLATTEGLQRIDPNTHDVTTYQANEALPGHLSSNNVLSVYEDNRGTLWVGTSNGVNKANLDENSFYARQITYTAQPVRLWENVITSIHEDKNGFVWLGTGKGLYKFNPHTYNITHIPFTGKTKAPGPVAELSATEISVVHEDFLGRLWVGTASGLFLINNDGTVKHYPSKIPVKSMDEDASGKFWIPGGNETSGRAVMAVFDLRKLTFTYTEYPLNDPAGLKDMYLNGILVGRTGDVWVATQSWGINRMNTRTGKFTYYLPDSVVPDKNLNGRFIVCLYEDSKGIIWAGSKMSGLYRLDPETGAFKTFTTYDGLPSNKVVSIIGDEDGNLWLGTNKGLSRFDTKTNRFRNFDLTDGLPVNEFIAGSVTASKGKLLFGTANGFLLFFPDSIKKNTWVPPVYLTGMKVLEKNTPIPSGTLELPYDENFLSFDFVALNYDVPEKNQYAYQLEGLDKSWIYAGTRRYANYPGLPPGSYTFRVKASNNDGIWNEKGSALTIVIHPPWWKTWWFYLLCIAGIIAILYSIYHIRVARLKELLQVRNKIARDLHDDVGSTLSSISIMTEVAKQKLPGSSAILEKIGSDAQQMQESMSDIVWAINPKNDRLEDILRRMKLFASEMLETNNIKLNFRSTEGSNFLKLSMNQRRNLYFIFKEAITNLARYSGAENATIEISFEHRFVELLIKDDGKGFDTIQHTMGGNGLYNMQKRAEDLNGILKIDSVKNQGTTVSLRFKIT